VDLDVRIAAVNDGRRQVLALVADGHRHNLALLTSLGRIFERNHTMLHRDEVPLAEISSRAVAGLAEVVLGVQLDEALAPFAEQPHGHEAHLALELTLDLVHERALLRSGRRHGFRLTLAVGSRFTHVRLARSDDAAREILLEFRQAGIIRGKLLRHRSLRRPTSEAEGQGCEREGETDIHEESTDGHCVLRIRHLNPGTLADAGPQLPNSAAVTRKTHVWLCG
jgi:hypothetical protein